MLNPKAGHAHVPHPASALPPDRCDRCGSIIANGARQFTSKAFRHRLYTQRLRASLSNGDQFRFGRIQGDTLVGLAPGFRPDDTGAGGAPRT